MNDLEQSNVEFDSTRWSLVDVLRNGDDAERRQALEALSAIYWPAVYSYLRRKGHVREKAAEVTQAFFSDVVLQRQLFERADAQRARLRSLLLHALGNFLVDQHRRSTSRGEKIRVPFDVAELEHMAAGTEASDPEDVFHRRWASGVLEESLRRAENHFREHDQPNHWAAFVAKVLGPSLHGTTPPLSADIAESLGFESAVALNNAVHAVKTRQRNFLKQIAAETTSGEGLADEEYRDLLGILT